MKQKLIKITETHYIIVDDSIDIVENFYCFKDGKIRQVSYLGQDNGNIITHSTQPLNTNFNDWFDAKIITLSEVEELINGYSVEKMANLHRVNISDDWSNASYIEGFKTHQKLVKDKMFTIEDMKKAFNAGYDLNTWEQLSIPNDEIDYLNNHDYIQSLLPKTEWDVEFDEQGKLQIK